MKSFKFNYIVFENNKIVEHSICKQMILNENGVEIIDSASCGLHIIYKDAKEDFHITINPNAKLEIMETYEGVCNFKKHIVINPYATLDKITFNKTKSSSVKEKAILFCGAIANSSFAQISNGDIEDEIEYDLISEGASANIMNTAIAKGDEIKKLTVKVTSKAKNTSGNIQSFGVSKDSASLIFNGYGVIEKGMSKSSSKQEQKIMIFDRRSKGEANPYLLISENDVVASHAAAIGQMNKDHLYYLQSRGIDPNTAKKMITLGYIMPVATKISNDDLRKEFIDSIEKEILNNGH